MPHILQLPPHVADLIAAGEVVERPASVVKELTENAIDAGAHAVTVEIQNGGMTLIRVADDGCGIAPDEVPTAFLRHATSKIRDEYDLEAIGTLGFRGEALAAIAAVSEVRLLTRRQEDPMGAAFTIDAGEVVSQEEAGCPLGTTILVRDLFYNTPARLKFMKKDVAEGAACFAVVQRQALGHPEVSFKFLRDGKQELLTPGDGQLRSALYAVLGRDLALGFVPAEGSGEGMSVSGFVSLPTCCRGTRGYQFFYVNGRYVRSKNMAAALEQAYANQKMVGKFPGCVLHLATRLNAVDVNVHPTKQEVKFDREREVFATVYYAVLSALGADDARPQVRVTLPRSVPAESAQRAALLSDRQTTLLNAQQAALFNDATAPGGGAAWEIAGSPPPPRSVSPPSPVSPPPPGERSPEGPRAAGERSGPGAEAPRSAAETTRRAPAAPAADRPSPPPPAEPGAEETPPPWRVAGELFRTYIVVEQGDKALLIDKHAAHERMNFDKMRAADYLPMSQTLLTPLVFAPAPEEGAALLEHLEELDRVGFQVEDFGGGALCVRAIPDYLDLGEVESALTEIAGKLSLTGTTGETERQDAIYHTMACKAAIKGGWKSGERELERVARAVMSGQVKYCPHGRPVCIELTRTELEKQFKRRA